MLKSLTGSFSIKRIGSTESSHSSTEKGMLLQFIAAPKRIFETLLFHDSQSSLKAGTVQSPRNVACCQIQTFDSAYGMLNCVIFQTHGWAWKKKIGIRCSISELERAKILSSEWNLVI